MWLHLNFEIIQIFCLCSGSCGSLFIFQFPDAVLQEIKTRHTALKYMSGMRIIKAVSINTTVVQSLEDNTGKLGPKEQRSSEFEKFR